MLGVLEEIRCVVATLLFLVEELDVLGTVGLVLFFLLLLERARVGESIVVSLSEEESSSDEEVTLEEFLEEFLEDVLLVAFALA